MKKSLFAVVTALALFTTLFASACGKDDDDDNNNNNNTNGRREVTMQGVVYSPGNLQIAPGETVTWVNTDNMLHTVTAVDGSFDSGNLDPGETFQYTFTEEGTYNYFCQVHVGMSGTITVVAP